MNGIPKPNSVTLIVAKPKSGKTHLVKYILYNWVYNDLIDFAVVFTNTKFNGDYDFIEDGFVYGALTNDELERRIKKICRN